MNDQTELIPMDSSVFIDAAREAIVNLSPADPLRHTLKYMLIHARGISNAQPIDNILLDLRSHGYNFSGKGFQTSLLKRTRQQNNIFIGSGPSGFFLIETEQDAMVMRDFYVTRIRSEQQQLDRLTTLAMKKGWNL